MNPDQNKKTEQAAMIKSLYELAIDNTADALQRYEAMQEFRKNWRRYIKEHQIPAKESLIEIGIADKIDKIHINMMTLITINFGTSFQKLAEESTSSIPERADQAYKLVYDVENIKKNFRKQWDFVFTKEDFKSLKHYFQFETMCIRACDTFKALPQLVYDLNIKAAKQLYQEMLDDPKIRVYGAIGKIYNHLIQAGFDDESARSINNEKYKYSVEVFTRILEPDLDWHGFCEKMSAIAIERGEIKEPTCYFGPAPNANHGDFSDAGDVISPSKKMRYFAATR